MQVFAQALKVMRTALIVTSVEEQVQVVNEEKAKAEASTAKHQGKYKDLEKERRGREKSRRNSVRKWSSSGPNIPRHRRTVRREFIGQSVRVTSKALRNVPPYFEKSSNCAHLISRSGRVFRSVGALHEGPPTGWIGWSRS